MGHGVDGQAKASSLDAEIAREVAETMQALATPSRVRILARLRGRLTSAHATQPSAAASPRVKGARPADSSVHRAAATHSAAARGRGT